MIYIAAALFGYFLGSVPIGYFVVRFRTGKDILEEGSGRIGSTNAIRAGGWGAGVVTFIGDLIKGAVAILVVRVLWADSLAEAIAGTAVILGHNASFVVWLLKRRWTGGVGATTYVGGAVALWWPLAFVLLPMIMLTLYIIQYSSVTSTLLVLTTSAIFLFRVLQGQAPPSDLIYAFLGGAFVIYALRPNYIHLRQGTERKMPYIRDKVNGLPKAIKALFDRPTGRKHST